MRRVLRWTLILLLPATVLSVWLVPNLFTDSSYSLTCCTQADINRPWQPGTTVDLHWTVESESGANLLLDRVFEKNPSHKVSITAFLSGPYSDLAGLKQAILTGTPTGDHPAVHDVHGSVIAMDDRTRPSTTPVTTFVLPADLPPGYYDLTLYWVDGNGGTGDPTNIVWVGSP